MKLNCKGLIFECDRLILFIFNLNLDFKEKFREIGMVLRMPISIYSLKQKDKLFLLKVYKGAHISVFSA